ncbi:3-keto-5-aminohexanoate cleavage protein [Haloplanus rubicundus]|uniref:3-keto-5-aminohexanoate cleavage protein n=1 Tax=Haloplanus rubicundus TaxID=1547898 RepID=A0A345E477_9EURY|nr:3-keto-5-aminohexanoate cleavage protein [Haloplanus rubicundus]AXG06999.1 3-keto-5-aminohexanoate cleavage protein [Haloplanus rubicundus]
MRQFDKTIISCAVTGAIHTPTMSPHLPITAEEIASEAIAAADAGASIVHLHVRDEETGEPITDLDLFREVAERVAAGCDAVVQPTTGGAPTMAPEERIRVVPELEPEMASCNMGSINFGLYQLVEKYDEFEYDWEADYLSGTRDLIFRNTFEDLETILPVFDDHGTMPELEVYDVGHLYNAKHLLDRGLLSTPLHIQFVMGIHGGIGASAKNLTHLVDVADDLFGDDFSFSVIGAGRNEFPLGTQGVSMGGNARVGLEDNLYLERGRLAESNAELVEKMVRLTQEVTGRDVATPAETREFLGLKGQDATNF